MVWHGNPLTFDEFLDLPIIERILDNEALNELIEASNTRPKDTR